jgi:hypothetical protein
LLDQSIQLPLYGSFYFLGMDKCSPFKRKQQNKTQSQETIVLDMASAYCTRP